MAALKAPLALAFVLALALLAPAAAASDAVIRLEQEGGVWNGQSGVTPDPTAVGSVELWVPEGARVHAVTTVSEGVSAPAQWRASGPSAIVVQLPRYATLALATFDTSDKRPYAFRYEAPQDYGELVISIIVPEGDVVESADAFVERASSGISTIRRLDATEGTTIAIRVVDESRVGEFPLLLTIGGLATIILVGTLVWHRVRPPLQGRAPQKFLDHLSELQARLVPPVLVFALLNLFYFTSGLRADAPYVTWGADGSVAARAFEAIAERLVPADVQLVVLRPADAVLAQVGMCLFLAFATVLPLLVYELAAFIGPGLEARERSVAMRVLPLVSGLFLAGALLAYLVMAPLMIRTLYGYAPGIGAAPLLAVGDLVSFALLIILSLGLAFELPVVMYVLARLGLVRSRTFGKYVRHAILIIVVAAGLITPDPSVVSQLLLAVPIVGLYVLGIGAAAFGERARPSV